MHAMDAVELTGTVAFAAIGAFGAQAVLEVVRALNLLGVVDGCDRKILALAEDGSEPALT